MKRLATLVALTISLFCSAQTFNRLNGPFGGNVLQLEYDAANTKVWALVNIVESENTLFYSTDNGASWTQINKPAQVGFAIRTFTLNGSTLVITDGFGKLQTSSDGGVTWVESGVAMTTPDVVYLLKKLPAPDAYVVAGRTGLQLTVDKGATWKRLYTITQSFVSTSFDLDITSTGDIYFTNPYVGLLKYKYPANPTNLASWSEASWITAFPKVISDVVDNGFNTTILASGKVMFSYTKADFFGGVSVSADGETNWTAQTLPANANFSYPLLASSPSGKAYLYVNPNSGQSYQWEFTEPSTWVSKASWPTDIIQAEAIRCALWRTGTQVLVGAASSGVFTSINSGTSWSSTSTGMKFGQGSQIEVMLDGKLIELQGIFPRAYWYSTDKGVTWQSKNLGVDLSLLFRIDPSTLLVTSLGNNLVTTDGINWTTIANPAGVTQFKDVFVFSGTDIFGIGQNGTIWESINKGTTWTKIDAGALPVNFSPSKLTRDTDGFFYVLGYDGSQPQIWKFDSNVSPWTITRVGQSLSTELFDLSAPGSDVIFSLNNKLYAQATSGLYSSSDKGATFNFLGSFNGFARVKPITQGTLRGFAYINQYGQVSVSQDEGKTITNIPLADNLTRVTDFSLNAGGDTFYFSALNSPALEFVTSTTNKLLLPPAEQTPYIDFNWQKVAGGPFSGPIKNLLKTSNGELFAVGASRFYHYNTATSTWDELLAGITDAYINPSDKIYVIAASLPNKPLTTYVSTNNGASFTPTSASANINSINAMIVNDVGSIFLAASNGLYRSADGGATYTSIDNSGFQNLAISSSSVLFAVKSSGSGLLRSTDKGATWTAAESGLTPSTDAIISISAMDAGYVAVSTQRNVFITANDGTTWASAGTGISASDFQSSFARGLYVSPTGEYWLRMVGYDANAVPYTVIYTSTNRGASWTSKATISRDFRALIWKGTDIYAGAQSDIQHVTPGVFKSTDGGLTFAPFQTKGLSDNQTTNLEIYDRKLYAVVNSAVYVSADQGQTMTQITAIDLPMTGLFKSPDGSLIAFGTAAIFRTTDGSTWTKLANPAKVGFKYLTSYDGLVYYAFVTGNVYGVATSTDLVNWTKLSMNFPTDFSDLTSLAVGSNGVVYFRASVKEGNNLVYGAYQYSSGAWSKLTFTTNTVNLTAAGGKVYLYDYVAAKIYSSIDGLNWTSKSAPSGSKLTITALNYFFISSTAGVLWLSRDQGTTWQSVSYSGETNWNEFNSIVLNESTGIAFGAINGFPVLKSSGVVVPTDTTPPAIATLVPANNATGVLPTATLSITFDQAAFPVAGKKVRVVDSANPSGFVESIDAAAAVQFDKTFTFTPSTGTLKYSPLSGASQSYFITVEPGAFVDIFGNPNTSIVDNSRWKFTMATQPDNVKPTINFTNSVANNFSNGDANKTITLGITDNIGVASAKVFYRKISSSDPFGTGKEITETTAGSGSYTFQPTASEFGSLGIEYYFEAQDAVGNKAVSPDNGTYHYSYITFPEGKKPTISPVLPPGTETKDYRIISIPYTFTSSKVSDLLVPSLGTYDPKVWRLLTLNPSATDWTELDASSTLEYAKGYWLIYKPGGSPTLAVNATPGVTKTNVTSIILNPGWNQIGNPYPFDIDWATVLAANPGVTVGATGILNNLKAFTGEGDFTVTKTLKATQGGFAFNGGASAVTIKVPVVATGSGGRAESFTSRLDATDWRLTLSLSNGSLVSNLGGIGMSANASESVDAFDDLNPPIFQDYLRVDFPHPEAKIKKLGVDVVPVSDEYTWNFTVRTNQAGLTMLKWNNAEFGSNAKELYLFDVALQVPINMRESNSYVFDPNVSKSFRIYFGEDLEKKIRPDVVMLGDAFPNPSSGLSTIPFTLPNQGVRFNVKLEVYDLLGKKHATLHDGELDAGFYRYTWNGEDARNGIYVYRLLVASEQGQFAQSGKIMLKK